MSIYKYNQTVWLTIPALWLIHDITEKNEMKKRSQMKTKTCNKNKQAFVRLKCILLIRDWMRIKKKVKHSF